MNKQISAYRELTESERQRGRETESESSDGRRPLAFAFWNGQHVSTVPCTPLPLSLLLSAAFSTPSSPIGRSFQFACISMQTALKLFPFWSRTASSLLLLWLFSMLLLLLLLLLVLLPLLLLLLLYYACAEHFLCTRFIWLCAKCFAASFCCCLLSFFSTCMCVWEFVCVGN